MQARVSMPSEVSAGQAGSLYFSYRDAKGRVHIVDQESLVPAGARHLRRITLTQRLADPPEIGRHVIAQAHNPWVIGAVCVWVLGVVFIRPLRKVMLRMGLVTVFLGFSAVGALQAVQHVTDRSARSFMQEPATWVQAATRLMSRLRSSQTQLETVTEEMQAGEMTDQPDKNAPHRPAGRPSQRH